MNKRILTLAALTALTSAPAFTQEGGEEAPAAAQTFSEWEEVEVLDVENDIWDKCTVLAAYPGAYRVSCNYEKSLRRDIHVRAPGGAPGASAAQPVSGPPFKKNDIILATKMGLPDDWTLCIVLRNEVTKSNNYVVDCGTEVRVLPKWVRKDPKTP